MRLNEFGGAQLFPARLALVAARAGRAAVRACPLDVAVGEKAPAVGAIGLRKRILKNIPAVEQGKKDVLGDAGVVFRAGGGEEVK